MRVYLWLCLLCCLPLFSLAQETGKGKVPPFVKGRVFDENRDPMVGVLVLIPGTTRGVTTGTEGEYHLDLQPQDTLLEFSFLGYQTRRIHVLRRNHPDNLNVEIFDMNTLATQNLSKQKFDLITSNASLQWLDLKQVLPTLANMLNKKGILLLSTFGEMNLKEIKQSTGLGLKYFSTKELEQIFKPYFSDIKITEEIVNLEFQNALEVFKHLKLSGVNSLGFYRLNKQFLKEFEEKFQNKLTYHPIFILCKKDTK